MNESADTGKYYGGLQNQLSKMWEEHGPDTVHEILDTMSREELVFLVMMNVGRDAVVS